MSFNHKNLLNEEKENVGSYKVRLFSGGETENVSPNQEEDNLQNDNNNDDNPPNEVTETDNTEMRETETSDNLSKEQYAAMCIELIGEALENYNLVYVPNSDVKHAKKLGAITPIQLLTKNQPTNPKKMICSILRRLQNQTFIPDEKSNQTKSINYADKLCNQNINQVPQQCNANNLRSPNIYRMHKPINSRGQIRVTHTFEQSERKLCNGNELNTSNVNDMETKSYIARVIDEGKDDCNNIWKMDRILQRTEGTRGNESGGLTRGVVNISRHPNNSPMPDFVHCGDLTSMDSDPDNIESEENEDHNRAYIETCNYFFNLDEEPIEEEEEECKNISRDSNSPMRSTGGEHISISNENEMLNNSEGLIKLNSSYDRLLIDNQYSKREANNPKKVELTASNVQQHCRQPERIPSLAVVIETECPDSLCNLSIDDEQTFENMSRLLDSEDLEVTIEDYFSD